MKLVEATPQGRQIVERYGNGGFRVSGRQYSGPLLVLVDRCVPLDAASVEALTVAALAPVLDPANAVEVLLVGAGGGIAQLPDAVVAALAAARIGHDTMNTGAACRTYNVLLNEGRHVAAALIPVP